MVCYVSAYTSPWYNNSNVRTLVHWLRGGCPLGVQCVRNCLPKNFLRGASAAITVCACRYQTSRHLPDFQRTRAAITVCVCRYQTSSAHQQPSPRLTESRFTKSLHAFTGPYPTLFARAAREKKLGPADPHNIYIYMAFILSVPWSPRPFISFWGAKNVREEWGGANDGGCNAKNAKKTSFPPQASCECSLS